MSGPYRLASGGHAIDRSCRISFRFNGRTYFGFHGDTLASALLANSVRIVGRSFKYHRPRGIVTAGPEEPNALVRVGAGCDATPNLKATEVPLVEGLEATSVNCWPGPRFDIGAINQLFAAALPAGFYYKTFMWPNWRWFEGAIRRAAGLGVAPDGRDPETYTHASLHCETLVIGGGPAGMLAATEAAAQGSRVVLLDSGNVEPEAGAAITVLTRTTAFGAYDHGLIGAIEQRDGAGARQRLWLIRAARIVMATGAIERPLVFPGNDRPGVMLASAVGKYLDDFGVLCGRKIVIFTNNSSIYPLVRKLTAAGAQVTVLDARLVPEGAELEMVEGGSVRAATLVASVQGARGVKRLSLMHADGTAAGSLACDCLAISGGWSPTVHLFSQAGGQLEWDVPNAMFVPGKGPACIVAKGAAAGELGADYTIEPLWRVSAPGKAFVDQSNDVTAADIALAARENYVSVEHLKRYTTLGMAPDQGKTSNVNGLAIMGEETCRLPAEVGTTKFRPPYTPVTIGALAGTGVREMYHPVRHLRAHSWHVDQGAVFEDYGGWARPTAYPLGDEDWETAVRREVLAVRQAVGLYDATPLGKIEVAGPDAVRFLDRIYVGNVSSLKVGQARYGLMLNENGAIIDDGIFVRMADTHFLIHTTSGGADRIGSMLEEWLQCEWPDLDLVTVPVTTLWATFVISGPAARRVVANAITDIDLDDFPHMAFRVGKVAGIPARVLRASFTGELSYEISVHAGLGETLAQALMVAGSTFGIVPYGVEALTTMRTEKGHIIVGVDTEGVTLPDDLGMGGAIAKKASDFIGRRSLTRPDALRPDRLQLVGLRVEGNARLPVGAHVLRDGIVPGAIDGHVTSSVESPVLGFPIALALVRSGRRRVGEAVAIYDMGKRYRATIVDNCFFDREGARLRG